MTTNALPERTDATAQAAVKNAVRAAAEGVEMPPIVEQYYEFCAWLLPKVSKFEKDQKYILGCLEEPPSGVIIATRCPFGHSTLFGSYFVSPQSDTSFQYPLFVPPRLSRRSSCATSVRGSSKHPLGTRLQNHALDALDLIINAAFSPRDRKAQHLGEALLKKPLAAVLPGSRLSRADQPLILGYEARLGRQETGKDSNT